MKYKRQHWTSKLSVQVKVGDDTVFVPVVDDLDDEQLVWHYERALDEEDYEYTAVCHIEAERRDISKYLKS